MDDFSGEMKLIVPKGCDNSPRKQIVIDFTVAMLKHQDNIIREYAHESIIWEQLRDNRKIEGQSAFISGLYHDAIDCLEIHQVITHGKFASINGAMSLTNGTTVNFCDVYTFSGASKSGKVKEIKSFRL